MGKFLRIFFFVLFRIALIINTLQINITLYML
nr:MAG TPA: hypothetical protein [Caudoviricetes sp.]